MRSEYFDNCARVSLEREQDWLVSAVDRHKVCRIVEDIPRFVSEANYADSFGKQWHRYASVQMDSEKLKKISEQRFYQYTGWKKEELKGKKVLEVGCGAGRFTEIMLKAGARVYAIDYSSAIEVAVRNNRDFSSNLIPAQADILYSL